MSFGDKRLDDAFDKWVTSTPEDDEDPDEDDEDLEFDENGEVIIPMDKQSIEIRQILTEGAEEE